MPGIVRFNDDPTTGILVGVRPNAALVAKAPELLEALEALISQHDHPVRDGKSAERWAAARAVVAQALDQ